MSNQTSVHNRETNVKFDNDDDPLVSMLKRLGCYDEHVAVQECIFDHRDWRVCKKETESFRKCYETNKKKGDHKIVN